MLQVHDELVLEVPEAELARVQRELPALMTGVAGLSVPLVVDVGVGPNWDAGALTPASADTVRSHRGQRSSAGYAPNVSL